MEPKIISEDEKEAMKRMIEIRKEDKVKKIKNDLDDYDLSDLRDLCQLNLLSESLKD